MQQKWRPQMTDSERRRGWVFFGLYMLVFPYLNGWVQKLLMNGDGEPPIAEANVVYYTLLFTLAVLVFWTFLRHAFSLLVDWLPENAFAFGTGLALALVLQWLVMRLPYPVENPTTIQYLQEYAISPRATVVLLVVLIPLVEEVLFRGLVFGSLRQYSRVMAYIVTVLVYAFACVWRYALEIGDAAYLTLMVQYLPMSLALTWCYDNGGSIWSTVALHMALSGVQLFGILH